MAGVPDPRRHARSKEERGEGSFGLLGPSQLKHSGWTQPTAKGGRPASQSEPSLFHDTKFRLLCEHWRERAARGGCEFPEDRDAGGCRSEFAGWTESGRRTTTALRIPRVRRTRAAAQAAQTRASDDGVAHEAGRGWDARWRVACS
eukprot:351816-Chlamydomonas_euryale.AAC.6